MNAELLRLVLDADRGEYPGRLLIREMDLV